MNVSQHLVLVCTISDFVLLLCAVYGVWRTKTGSATAHRVSHDGVDVMYVLSG